MVIHGEIYRFRIILQTLTLIETHTNNDKDQEKGMAKRPVVKSQ